MPYSATGVLTPTPATAGLIYLKDAAKLANPATTFAVHPYSAGFGTVYLMGAQLQNPLAISMGPSVDNASATVFHVAATMNGELWVTDPIKDFHVTVSVGADLELSTSNGILAVTRSHITESHNVHDCDILFVTGACDGLVNQVMESAFGGSDAFAKMINQMLVPQVNQFLAGPDGRALWFTFLQSRLNTFLDPSAPQWTVDHTSPVLANGQLSYKAYRSVAPVAPTCSMTATCVGDVTISCFSDANELLFSLQNPNGTYGQTYSIPGMMLVGRFPQGRTVNASVCENNELGTVCTPVSATVPVGYCGTSSGVSGFCAAYPPGKCPQLGNQPPAGGGGGQAE